MLVSPLDDDRLIATVMRAGCGCDVPRRRQPPIRPQPPYALSRPASTRQVRDGRVPCRQYSILATDRPKPQSKRTAASPARGTLDVKISILDDYHDTLRTLACFRKLDGHDVEIWNDHAQDLDTLAQRLQDT
jgi:hypothetical protein